MLARIAQSPKPFEEAWIGPGSDLGQHIQQLLGKSASIRQLGETAEAFNEVRILFEGHLNGVRARATDFILHGLTLPRCAPGASELIPSRSQAITGALAADAVAAGVGSKTDFLLMQYDEAKERCNDAAREFARMSDLAPAASAIASKLADARADLAEAERLRGEIAKRFDEVVKEIREAAPTAGGKKPSEIAGPALAALHAVVGEAAGLAGSVKSLAVSEKRLQELDALLGAAATGKLEDPSLSQEQRRLAVALGGLPNLADSFYDLAEASGAVPRYALLVVREQVRAERDRAAADVAQATGRVEILQAMFDAQVLEFRRYARAARFYEEARTRDAGSLLRRSPAVVLSAASPTSVRERAKAAVAWSAFAWNNTETRMAGYEGALLRLEYDRRQSNSRVALAEWKGMLTALADGQVGYHEAGIKPEELSSLAVQLLQAAGLFTIAAGVK